MQMSHLHSTVATTHHQAPSPVSSHDYNKQGDTNKASVSSQTPQRRNKRSPGASVTDLTINGVVRRAVKFSPNRELYWVGSGSERLTPDSIRPATAYVYARVKKHDGSIQTVAIDPRQLRPGHSDDALLSLDGDMLIASESDGFYRIATPIYPSGEASVSTQLVRSTDPENSQVYALEQQADGSRRLTAVRDVGQHRPGNNVVLSQEDGRLLLESSDGRFYPFFGGLLSPSRFTESPASRGVPTEINRSLREMLDGRVGGLLYANLMPPVALENDIVTVQRNPLEEGGIRPRHLLRLNGENTDIPLSDRYTVSVQRFGEREDGSSFNTITRFIATRDGRVFVDGREEPGDTSSRRRFIEIDPNRIERNEQTGEFILYRNGLPLEPIYHPEAGPARLQDVSYRVPLLAFVIHNGSLTLDAPQPIPAPPLYEAEGQDASRHIHRELKSITEDHLYPDELTIWKTDGSSSLTQDSWSDINPISKIAAMQMASASNPPNFKLSHHPDWTVWRKSKMTDENFEINARQMHNTNTIVTLQDGSRIIPVTGNDITQINGADLMVNSSGLNFENNYVGLLYLDRKGRITALEAAVDVNKRESAYFDSDGVLTKVHRGNDLVETHFSSTAASRYTSARGITLSTETPENIGGAKPVPSNLSPINDRLQVVKNISEKNYRDWSQWQDYSPYRDTFFTTGENYGISEYGKWLVDNNTLLKFNDGSFAIGLNTDDLTKLNPYLPTQYNWDGYFLDSNGQAYFDKNGRFVGFVGTDGQEAGTNDLAFLYVNGEFVKVNDDTFHHAVSSDYPNNFFDSHYLSPSTSSKRFVIPG